MGGSFNPVHIGHMLLATYLVEFGIVDRVLMMLSPANPLKDLSSEYPSESDRMRMLEIACSSVDKIEPCDIELTMPRPSYSINSLRKLAESYPDSRIRLIVGSDNWNQFNRWRDFEKIIMEFNPIVYPRPGYPIDKTTLPEGVTAVDSPIFEISSTFVRNTLAAGKRIDLFLPPGVAGYIRQQNLYASPLTS
ncbi:MAG: nicotinate-nucleotide adenylyltransferase [Paramuribaculum sp.]|nr:nicotinate-nucleotide adenylyltransferase [Paramuribaculum sp.]MDE6488956.1 nicotinate-nucleotide adenylyltransferase [Paramuribaculum sp.]